VTVKGEPKYGLHALRHFYASWCINRKQDGGLELPLKLVPGTRPWCSPAIGTGICFRAATTAPNLQQRRPHSWAERDTIAT
jgi:hypothetical protein